MIRGIADNGAMTQIRFHSALPAHRPAPVSPPVQPVAVPVFGAKVRHGERGNLLYKPLVRLVAMYFTQPKLMRKLTPGAFRTYLEPGEALKRFGPIGTVSFKSLDGLDLKGYWMPHSKTADQTVVLGHGYKANWRAVLGVADKIRSMGYNVFMFDFRAHGDSAGEISSFGFHEGKDAAAAVQYVDEHYGDRSKKLFYYGHSMGAAAIMMTPASLKKYPDALKTVTDRLDGMVLDSPYANIDVKNVPEIRGFLDGSIKGWYAPIVRNLARQVVNGLEDEAQRYLKLDRPFSKLHPATIMKTSPQLAGKPILMIHGVKDQTTAFEQARHNFKTLKRVNPHVKLTILERSDHVSGVWNPKGDGSRYATALRGGNVFLEAIETFLQTHAAPAFA